MKFFRRLICLLVGLSFCLPATFAWGSEGHAIIGEIANRFLNDNVKQNIQYYLGTMTIEDACNWMDNMRSDPDYNYMKPWHYIDIPKDENYEPSTNENIINEIIIAFNELRHKKTLCDEQTKTDLLVLCHLIGDLHQPLHTGYLADRGGNEIKVNYFSEKTNLHHVWDSDIIEGENITADDCLKLYNADTPGEFDPIKGIHFVDWMKESRTLLNDVYDFNGKQLDREYVQKNKLIIERQLLIAGIRLAAVLNKLFDSPLLTVQDNIHSSHSNTEIDASEASNYIGKNVTVCSKVYEVKNTGKVIFIDLGNKYPNNPLTVVIFQKDEYKFTGNIEDLYSNKNICVKGKIIEYKSKKEIIVDDPKEIKVL